MADKSLLAFPVCIKQEEEKYKLYIPDIDVERTVDTFAYALYRARELLEAEFVIEKIDPVSLPEDLCSVERVKELLNKNHKEEYLDTPIYYVDFDLRRTEIRGLGAVTVKLPQALINMVRPINLNLSAEVKGVIEKEIHRIAMLGQANRLVGHTAEILTENSKFYGEIKRVIRDDRTKKDSVIVQTSLYNVDKIPLNMITEFSETPVMMNKLGTFHFVNQAGYLSVYGTLWMNEKHLDVYMEFDPEEGFEQKRIFENLAQFAKDRYDIDERIRSSMAEYLINEDAIKILVPEYTNQIDDQKKQKITEQIKNTLTVWFVDMALNKTISMNYHYVNEFGDIEIIAEVKLDEKVFRFNINKVTVFGKNVDDEYDEEDKFDEYEEDEEIKKSED